MDTCDTDAISEKFAVIIDTMKELAMTAEAAGRNEMAALAGKAIVSADNAKAAAIAALIAEG